MTMGMFQMRFDASTSITRGTIPLFNSRGRHHLRENLNIVILLVRRESVCYSSFSMIKIGIVGGTGYTGVELLRLLAVHPEVKLSVITSRAEAGKRVDEMFPNLRGYVDLAFTEPDSKKLSVCDLVFSA